MEIDNSWLTKRRSAGLVTSFVGASGFLWSGAANWLLGKFLDYLLPNLRWETFITLPWAAILSGCALLFGISLLLWPESNRKPVHRALHSHVDRVLARYNSTSPKNWQEVNRLADSVAVSLKKAGFVVPATNDDWAIRAIVMQHYLNDIVHFLNDGHMKEAKVAAISTVERLAKEFQGTAE